MLENITLWRALVWRQITLKFSESTGEPHNLTAVKLVSLSKHGHHTNYVSNCPLTNDNKIKQGHNYNCLPAFLIGEGNINVIFLLSRIECFNVLKI